MPTDDLRAQQREWLTGAYSGLFPIAAAITNNPKIAEEVVGIAVVSALLQIEQAKCLAATQGQFCAWVRAIVRNKSKTVIGAGRDRIKRRSLCRGDILADLHAEHIRRKHEGFLQALEAETTE